MVLPKKNQSAEASGIAELRAQAKVQREYHERIEGRIEKMYSMLRRLETALILLHPAEFWNGMADLPRRHQTSQYRRVTDPASYELERRDSEDPVEDIEAIVADRDEPVDVDDEDDDVEVLGDDKGDDKVVVHASSVPRAPPSSPAMRTRRNTKSLSPVVRVVPQPPRSSVRCDEQKA